MPGPRSPWAVALARLGRSRVALAGLAVLLVMGLLALLAPWIAPYDPLAIDLPNQLQHPAPTTGWAPTCWGGTFSPVSSMAGVPRW